MKNYSVSLVLIKKKSKGHMDITLMGSICEAASEAEALGQIVEIAFREFSGHTMSNYMVIEVPALEVKTEPENVLKEEPELAVVEAVFPIAEKESPNLKPEIKPEEPPVKPVKHRGRPSKQQLEERARTEFPRKYLSSVELSRYKTTGTLPEMPGVQAQPKKFVVSGAYVQGPAPKNKIIDKPQNHKR